MHSNWSSSTSRDALEGRFDIEHSLIVSQILAHIDFLDELIGRLSEEIEQRDRRSPPSATC